MGKKGAVRRSPEEQAEDMRARADLMEAAGHLRQAAAFARKGDKSSAEDSIVKAKAKMKG